MLRETPVEQQSGTMVAIRCEDQQQSIDSRSCFCPVNPMVYIVKDKLCTWEGNYCLCMSKHENDSSPVTPTPEYARPVVSYADGVLYSRFDPVTIMEDR